MGSFIVSAPKRKIRHRLTPCSSVELWNDQRVHVGLQKPEKSAIARVKAAILEASLGWKINMSLIGLVKVARFCKFGRQIGNTGPCLFTV